MPGLYDISSNANVSVGNTVGLYIGSGNVAVVNSAGQLIGILSNSASVGFYLTNANTQVTSTVLTSGVAAGTYGDAYTVPQITVGADGRVTTVANITISGGGAGGFGNANVAAYLPTYTGVLNPSTLTAGNIITTAGVYWANGQPYSSGSTYGNTQVAQFLPVYNGVIKSGTIFNGSGLAIQGPDYAQMQWTNGAAVPASEYNLGTGSWFFLDSGGGVFESNSTGTIRSITFGNDATLTAQGNITGANLTTAGNVTASYVKGNGSLLTNLPVQPGTYSNANVAGYLPGYAGPLSSTIISAGNVDATGYFIGDGSKLTNLPVQAGTYCKSCLSISQWCEYSIRYWWNILKYQCCGILNNSNNHHLR